MCVLVFYFILAMIIISATGEVNPEGKGGFLCQVINIWETHFKLAA